MRHVCPEHGTLCGRITVLERRTRSPVWLPVIVALVTSAGVVAAATLSSDTVPPNLEERVAAAVVRLTRQERDEAFQDGRAIGRSEGRVDQILEEKSAKQTVTGSYEKR